MQKKALLELEKSYEGILGNFFDDELDVEVFINNYAQFWQIKQKAKTMLNSKG